MPLDRTADHSGQRNAHLETRGTLRKRKVLHKTTEVSKWVLALLDIRCRDRAWGRIAKLEPWEGTTTIPVHVLNSDQETVGQAFREPGG